jgi:hypothetical protein
MLSISCLSSMTSTGCIWTLAMPLWILDLTLGVCIDALLFCVVGIIPYAKEKKSCFVIYMHGHFHTWSMRSAWFLAPCGIPP